MLPAYVYDDLTSIISKLWWSSKVILSWIQICQLKREGSWFLGFEVFQSFNVALLVKQGWRLIFTPHSLKARLLKEKYFPSSSFWDARIPINVFSIWKGICDARRILEKGSKWRIVSGENVKSMVWSLDPKAFYIHALLHLLVQVIIFEIWMFRIFWCSKLIGMKS